MHPSRNTSAREDATFIGALSHLVGLVAALPFPIDAVFKSLAASGLSLHALAAYLGLTREAVFSAVIRLGLPTPSETPLRVASAKGWMVEDIQKLIAWRSTGVHPEVIGQNLSRSRSANAVRSKSRRLGLSAPPRKSLFRPSPEQLTLAFAAPIQSAPRPRRDGRTSRSPDKAKPTHGTRPLLPLTPPVVPKSLDELDVNDLTWVGSLRGRRGRPDAGVDGISTNHVAAHAFGLVTCAGVDRFAAAELLGMTVDSYRTLRTRFGLPPIAHRSSFTSVFDIEVAEETIKRSGLELITSMRRTEGRPPQLFWRFRDERHVRLAPTERPQRARGEPTFSKPMTIFTRAMIDAQIQVEARKSAAPIIRDRQTRPLPPSIASQRLIFEPSRPAIPSSALPTFVVSKPPFATARASISS